MTILSSRITTRCTLHAWFERGSIATWSVEDVSGPRRTGKAWAVEILDDEYTGRLIRTSTTFPAPRQQFGVCRRLLLRRWVRRSDTRIASGK